MSSLAEWVGYRTRPTEQVDPYAGGGGALPAPLAGAICPFELGASPLESFPTADDALHFAPHVMVGGTLEYARGMVVRAVTQLPQASA